MTFPFWSSVDCKEKELKIENKDRGRDCNIRKQSVDRKMGEDLKIKGEGKNCFFFICKMC